MGSLGGILLADDEPEFLESTATLLAQEGYRCDTAVSAENGRENLRTSAYDLLISDVMLPGNDGLEFVREASQMQPGLPIVLITGYPSLDTAIEAVRLPVSAYLTKPIPWAELREEVRTALECSRSYGMLANVCHSLQSTLEKVRRLQASLIVPHKDARDESAVGMLDVALNDLMSAAHTLQRLHAATSLPEERRTLCDRAGCARQRLLEDAVREAIDVIRTTKHFCKRKELGDLRLKLEKLLA